MQVVGLLVLWNQAEPPQNKKELIKCCSMLPCVSH